METIKTNKARKTETDGLQHLISDVNNLRERLKLTRFHLERTENQNKALVQENKDLRACLEKINEYAGKANSIKAIVQQQTTILPIKDVKKIVENETKKDK